MDVFLIYAFLSLATFYIIRWCVREVMDLVAAMKAVIDWVKAYIQIDIH